METKGKMSDRLCELISELGISQMQFGRRLGLSRASVSKWIKGNNDPSESTIRQICQEYGVSYIWLKRGDGDMFVEKGSSEINTYYNLDDDDMKLINYYSSLSQESKKMVKAIVQTFKEMQ